MSLRRAALVRKKGRDTRPNAVVRRTVADRAGYGCERCGQVLHDGTNWTRTHSFHHRWPRGRGGPNTVPNIVLLCGSGITGCHGQVESRRTAAYDTGWLLTTGADPASVAVLVHDRGHVLLTDDGDYVEAA